MKTLKANNMIGHERQEFESVYIYVYLNRQNVIYVGKGTFGDNFRRAEDLKGHSGIDPDSVSAIHIIDACMAEEQQIVEDNYITMYGGLEVLNNRRREVSSKKYYQKIVEYHARRNISRHELDNRTIRGASGGAVAESRELAQEILDNVEIREDVLFVGNGGYGTVNLAKVSIETNNIKNFTIANTRYENNTELTNMAQQEKINFTVINEDFLQRDFGQTKYDLIIMNPPWTKFGVKFIDKAVSLLKEGGKLVCIMGQAPFSPLSEKSAKKSGTFYDLLQKGSFERIETFYHNGSFGARKGHFHNVGTEVWFIWTKDKSNKTTTIVNRVGEEFTYEFDGNEWMIPQEPKEYTEKYLDFDNGFRFTGGEKNHYTSFRLNVEEVKFRDEYNNTGKHTFINSDEVDKEKLRSFISKNTKRTLALYAGHISSVIVHPPIKRELILKDEYL